MHRRVSYLSIPAASTTYPQVRTEDGLYRKALWASGEDVRLIEYDQVSDAHTLKFNAGGRLKA
jgi:hypothetical protein